MGRVAGLTGEYGVCGGEGATYIARLECLESPVEQIFETKTWWRGVATTWTRKVESQSVIWCPCVLADGSVLDIARYLGFSNITIKIEFIIYIPRRYAKIYLRNIDALH